MDVIIIGAGGQGRVVLDILRADPARRFIAVGFLDANAALAGSDIHGVPVLGAMNQLPRLRQQHRGTLGAIVAIGDNRARRSCAEAVAEHGVELVNAIHPSAVVSPTAVLGRNVVLAAGAIVCTDARIADSVIINTGAVVDHECEVGPAVHIGPRAVLAGRVRVGAGAFIGMGASILQCLAIGEDSTIGAGAVVTHDVPPYVTAVGVPARVVKSHAPTVV